MAINFVSEEEKNGFWELSNTIQAGNYEEALNLSKNLLERFPGNKAIYHNQIGAMIYLSKNDYWGATSHYTKALEYGFDAEACEENIWESAVDSYKFLIDSEEGFCSLMIKIRTNLLPPMIWFKNTKVFSRMENMQMKLKNSITFSAYQKNCWKAITTILRHYRKTIRKNIRMENNAKW